MRELNQNACKHFHRFLFTKVRYYAILLIYSLERGFDMKKINISEPSVVAQSTTAPILFGGYQLPIIRCNAKGEIFVKFSARIDNPSTWGEEDGNPVYRSRNGGEAWKYMSDPLYSWITAQQPLPNGDFLEMREYALLDDLPPLPVGRPWLGTGGVRDVYLVDELIPILGDRIAKEFRAYRVKAGTNEIVEDTCKIHWKDMPCVLHEKCKLRRLFGQTLSGLRYKVDSKGSLWLPVPAPYVTPDGVLGSSRFCIHILRSDDNGYNWDYVSTIVYKDEYNSPNAISVEGFSEATLAFTEDGGIICVLRSGSLHPKNIGDDEHPAPIAYFCKSSDNGKTWSEPKPFYDYGVMPVMEKLDCGTILLSSGRPGVYLRTCEDPKGEEWSDIIPILTVPKKDYYTAYFEYSCSNTSMCVYDANTAYLAYSDFRLNAPNGQRAKSILVRKITVE